MTIRMRRRQQRRRAERPKIRRELYALRAEHFNPAQTEWAHRVWRGFERKWGVRRWDS